jgi:Tol biopolymer transport system component/DNA-binding winged helix-turn-helix (wHTH) protein
MAEQTQNAVVRFGVFEVNLRSGELRKHGLRLRLAGQPFKILAILLERPGEVVSREELQKTLWPDDTFVDFEHSLNSAIKKLRAALGDSAESPRYVETLPRLGYRFVAPVDAGEPPVVAPVQQTSADQESYDAEKLAVKPGLRMRSAFVLGALLATVAAAALLVVSFRQTRALPFEMTSTTRLTSAGQSLKAAISPDGRYIAHTLVNSGQESLLVRRATTLHDIEIVPPAPAHYLGITFSPDSETVYYVTHTTSEAVPAVLFRVPVMGGSAQKLKEDLASPVTFSPDGAKYAFVRESAGASTLMVADLDSGREQRLFFRKLPEILDYPAWSPDGRIIACTAVDSSMVSVRGSDARIIAVRVKDGSEQPLSGQTWGFIRQLAWLGDGSGLVMSARGRESGFLHVWYVSYPGGIGRKVTDGLNRQTGASVSADSHQLVTVEQTTISGIWRMRLTPGQHPEPVVSGLSGTSPPRWTPDGRILYEQELNGHRSIWIVNSDGTHQKQLTLAGNNDKPSVCGSGRLLAYISDRSGSPAIWTMDVDGGHPAMVVKAWPNMVPQLSPDGKWIVYTAIGSGDWTTLWKVPSGGGRAIELNDRLWMWPAISPDGKWIAGFYADKRLSTQTEADSLAVISSDGGRPSKVIPMPPSVSVSAIRWSRDGRQLTYVDDGKDGDNIWSQPLSGGAPHQVTHFRGASLFDFDWSPDGKQLVFAQGIQVRDVVLIQDAQRK